MDIRHLREEYQDRPLGKKEVAEDPYDQFAVWFSEACEGEVEEPNAMVLATASGEGLPSSRTLLLKRFDQAGLVFFTNYGSRKAAELAVNPHASMTFLWLPLNRQVVIDGKVKRLSEEESRDYFQRRPRGSQLGAWASEQGKVIDSREVLEKRYREVEKRYEGGEVPMPEYWGGFRLIPSYYEFWQGRPNRLHDRIRYRRARDGGWIIERLMP